MLGRDQTLAVETSMLVLPTSKLYHNDMKVCSCVVVMTSLTCLYWCNQSHAVCYAILTLCQSVCYLPVCLVRRSGLCSSPVDTAMPTNCGARVVQICQPCTLGRVTNTSSMLLTFCHRRPSVRLLRDTPTFCC